MAPCGAGEDWGKGAKLTCDYLIEHVSGNFTVHFRTRFLHYHWQSHTLHARGESCLPLEVGIRHLLSLISCSLTSKHFAAKRVIRYAYEVRVPPVDQLFVASRDHLRIAVMMRVNERRLCRLRE